MSAITESPDRVYSTPTRFEESEEERLQREIEESEALALQLMEEESMRAYRQQMEFLSSVEGLEGDALEAYNLSLQFLNEDYGVLVTEEVEEGQEGEEQSEEISYEALLDLGAQIGDVKTERWHERNQDIIASLPVTVFSPSSNGGDGRVVTDAKCLVCLCEYDKGEEMKSLPCEHRFHTECIEGWLADHDHCPLCKRCVEEEEEEEEEGKEEQV